VNQKLWHRVCKKILQNDLKPHFSEFSSVSRLKQLVVAAFSTDTAADDQLSTVRKAFGGTPSPFAIEWASERKPPSDEFGEAYRQLAGRDG
jgi:hypothetical protein